MENGSNYFCPCLWDGEERKCSSVQGAISSKHRLCLELRPRSRVMHKVQDQLSCLLCGGSRRFVCAGVGA